MSNDDKILKDIIAKSKIIRSKYRALKHNKYQEQKKFENIFKPITESLEDIKINNKILKDENTCDSKNFAIKDKKYADEILYKNENANLVSHNIVKSIGDIALKYINQPIEDKVYGIQRDKDNNLFIGKTPITINNNNNNIFVNNKWYTGTEGLYELLFLKKPEHYTREDRENYMQIIKDTNAYRRNYDPNGQISGNSGWKYLNIIRPALNVEKKIGNGIIPTHKIASDKNNEYIYWNDINELIDRLRLLLSSKQAGHTDHDNEKLSIIEELRESCIIE